ncbi:hypothetical protein ODZ84_16445 [Chryseobacterium fluminis]|uniref:hypothetical protein n=1 Tax=Chryseobacterium fluminis TaxID=2983606 RepID=UPI002252DB78|nr:hypothetical protein [Chryseobacterium sp. MMS21-Ot14]UZT96798.1 hypothetical protein ODZ84_16445 [Chryseobacterium sp. MMS21-Ot14]
MKTFYLIIICLFTIQALHAQKTRILIIDVSDPNENSVSLSGPKKCSSRCERKWLSIKPRELLAVQLKNANPLKYEYTINDNNISYFMDTATINQHLSSLDISPENPSVKNNSATYASIFVESKKLKEKLDHLEIFIDQFELKSMSEEVLGDDFFQIRDSLYITLKNVHYEAKKYKACLERGKNVEYSDAITDDQKETSKEFINYSIEKSETMLKSFESKFFFSNTFYTLPKDIQGKNIDAVEFTIKRLDKKTNKEDGSYGKYNVWISGGVKIDISAGVFLTSLYDEEYETRDVEGGTGQKQIALKKQGSYDFAFGSTVNTNFRMNSWIQPQINFGFIFTQNQKFQVILGGGLIFGREERWILSGGLSMGVVDRLADGFEKGNVYNLGTSGQIPVVKQFKFGHFIGITYNLSKVNAVSLK